LLKLGPDSTSKGGGTANQLIFYDVGGTVTADQYTTTDKYLFYCHGATGGTWSRSAVFTDI
jgi:hypothetical protein